jgi:K+-transporting ATPase ATPase B chain
MQRSEQSIIRKGFGFIGLISYIKNPLSLLLLILSCSAFIIFLQQISSHNDKALLYGQITFWLWMTMFFSMFMEFAYSRKKFKFISEKITSNHALIKKLNSLDNIDDYQKVKKSSIKSGNLILLHSGDEVPFDGEVIKGMSYVNETDITGSLEHKLKSPIKDNILIAGSIVEGGDWIVMKVSFASNKSFFTRVGRLLRNINRQPIPSEIALQKLMIGLSILFANVVFVIWVIASYSGVEIPVIYLIALMVVLLPTTISTLQRVIIYNGVVKLAARNIIVQDQIAFDNAVDLDIVLLDKTGTLTLGQRKMVNFKLTSKTDEKDYFRYLYLSSVNDNTEEGKNIKAFAIKNYKDLDPKINLKLYHYLPFSASNSISGCNYNNIEIRKGSMQAIAKYLGKTVESFPQEVQNIVKEVAKAHGTPLILTVNKKIIGIINLHDSFRKGVAKQIRSIENAGINTIMVTGDNAITASYIAKNLGIKNFYADCTPEKKLELIRSLQEQGFIVGMCGDGLNDALALAQADIGYTFEDRGYVHSILAGNIVAKHHNLLGIIELRNECKKITVRKGAITVYSIASDLAKYFIIVPALFITAFPSLSKLNIMQFQSIDSVLLASVIFNGLIIPALLPLLSYNLKNVQDTTYLWRIILLCGFGGIVSPLLFIKLIEFIIYKAGLI